MQSNNNGGGSGAGQEEAIKLPQAILDVIQNPHLDVGDIHACPNHTTETSRQVLLGIYFLRRCKNSYFMVSPKPLENSKACLLHSTQS